ncbi:triose-phosphate isomerase [Dongshaea marina]|uniref:triose-phosphate isomerase n=1 Tax=Dongshaea marina TaxID=2047966 RepID=UPI000D3E33F6|nr:triose-phosphate isomerase [Dongshaea marina]
MRQPLVMGNWKLNGTKASVEALIKGLVDPAANASNVTVAVCPPAVFLDQVERLTQGTAIKFGSQDADIHENGAFTGENSPVTLKEFGCTYALVGHSERRTLHAESDQVIAEKYAAVQKGGLLPVLCIGETLEQFEAGQTNQVVETQLKAVIDRNGVESLADAVIAYEPVWAIGTGKTATPEIAQNVHAHIRNYLKGFNAEIAAKVQILYGGSVKGANAKGLFGMEDIDGALVGGASLQADEFASIIEGAK